MIGTAILLDSAFAAADSGLSMHITVVTEISYNKNIYEADVRFLAEVEWCKEILVLLDDLQDDNDGGDCHRFSQ